MYVGHYFFLNLGIIFVITYIEHHHASAIGCMYMYICFWGMEPKYLLTCSPFLFKVQLHVCKTFVIYYIIFISVAVVGTH